MDNLGMFEKLELEKGAKLTNEEKLEVIKLLELEKSENDKTLDAFGHEVSFNGIKVLKRQYVKLPLTEYHIKEIEKCSKDLFYFVHNYCRILTKSGIDFPELREYQTEFLHKLASGNDIISSLPRQSGKSVTAGLYLLWCANFTPNLNIGIAANKLDLACEVLDKIKSIFIELPIWLQQGLISWNKTSISLENGSRILTSATTGDAFRGYSCIEKNEILELYDSIENKIKHITISELYKELETSPNNKYLINTEQGLKRFKGVIKSHLNHGYRLKFNDNTEIKVTGTHRLKVNKKIFRQVEKIKVNHKVLNKRVILKEKIYNTEFYDLFYVEDTHSYFHKGLIHHNCHILLIDECAFIPTNLWNDLTDSLFPSQDALARKQKILISTPNGINHWYHLVTGAKNNLNGYNFFTTEWDKVPRYDKNGNLKQKEEFKDEIIKKNGKKFFAQNYELEFIGSSSTLLSPEALRLLQPLPEDEIIFDSLFYGLRIFEECKKSHSYVIGVDPKKDGVDKLAIQVIDVTHLPFKQVASYNTDLSYLSAPSKIFDLGVYYNNAYIVVENNIDNSIVDTLFYQYDYDGEIYRDENKKILGFRTTIKTKKILLSLLKKLIEENKLLLYDKATIDEFFTFIEKKDGKFSAEDGLHDDLVMALMVSLAPFINVKNFDDFQGFLSFIETKNKEIENENEEFSKFFVGMSFSTQITDEDIGKNIIKDLY